MRERADEAAQLGGRERAIDPPVAFRQFGVVVLRAEHDLERPPEDRRLARGEAHVARQHELAAGAADAALDLRDRHQTADAEVAEQQRDRRFANELRRLGPVLRDPRHVNVGDEVVRVGTREHEHLHSRVGLGMLDERDEVEDQFRPEQVHVEGRTWGAMIVGTFGERPVPAGTEGRLGQFAELMATDIANTEARAEIKRLAQQEAALRRIATLIAQGIKPEQVFAAVADETAATFNAITAVLRYENEPPAVVIAGVSAETGIPIGTCWELAEGMVAREVYRTGRSARIVTGADYWSSRNWPAAEASARLGLVSQVGCPIIVEGSLWGAMTVNGREELSSDTEQRLEKFTELVTTAIANATTRAELVASRARIVAAGDEARRRIERNLHDGTQQQLIALGLDVQRVRAAIPDHQSQTRSALVGVEQDLEAILVDLRELSHGLHPPLLSRLGLGPSLQALARRSPIPVQLDVDLPERPAASLETAVYYAVSEALTNSIKHSHASEISVTISSGEKLRASIVDDGVGDADPSDGSGLTGLLDRIDALGGGFALDSPPQGGTRISIELPVEPTVAT